MNLTTMLKCSITIIFNFLFKLMLIFYNVKNKKTFILNWHPSRKDAASSCKKPEKEIENPSLKYSSA